MKIANGRLATSSQHIMIVESRTMLKDYRKCRLIVVSETDNLIEVYEKRQMMARQPTNLVSAMQSF